MRDRDDRLAGLYHLAGLRALGHHNARRVRPKLAVAEMVLRLMQLRLGDIEIRFGGVERSLRGVVVCFGGPALNSSECAFAPCYW